jgi:4-hydroxybutyrate dehydrogenase
MALILYITQVQLDHGAVRLLPEECAKAGMKKPLVVTDRGVRAAGVLDVALKALGDLPRAVFDETPSNPTEAAVRAAADVVRREGCDGLVAVGGGSTIQQPNGVALRAKHDRPL